MKFVDVKNDVAFRKIFGNENKKVILISFLNAVLGLEGQSRVKEVTLLNPFQLPRIVGEKSSIIDVRATDEKGSTFIVEMQVAEPAGFDKRVLLEVMPSDVDDEGLKEAYEEAAQHNWSKEAYDAYIYSGIREQDDRGRVELEKLRERNRIILGFFENGIPVSVIAKSVGISEGEVKNVIERQSNI